jgi:hypothetical protein
MALMSFDNSSTVGGNSAAHQRRKHQKPLRQIQCHSTVVELDFIIEEIDGTVAQRLSV